MKSLALGVVGMSIVVAVLFALLTTKRSPTQLVSPAPQSADSVVLAPHQQQSRVFLPVRVELSALNARLNNEVPLVFRGAEQNPVTSRALVEDVLTWVVRRGPIALTGVGQRLRLTVDAKGDSSIIGKFRTNRGTVGKIFKRITGVTEVPISVSARATATAEVLVKPELQDNWRVRPNLSGRVEVHKAEIPIAGLTTISVRSNIKRFLELEVENLLREMENRVLADRRLQMLVEREWRRLFKVEQIVDAPIAWLVVTPRGISASQVIIGDESLQIGVGLHAETRIEVKSDRPENPPTALPPLILTEQTPGYANLQGLAFAPWDILSQALTGKFKGRGVDAGGGITLKIKSLAISAWGEEVLLVMDFAAEGTVAKVATGKIYLTAKPLLNSDAQRLDFTELDYTLESRGLLASAAAWLLKSELLERINEHAVLDLSTYIERAKLSAERAVAKLVLGLPDGIHLDAKVHDVSIDGLHVTDDHLVVQASVSAGLQASVSSLSF